MVRAVGKRDAAEALAEAQASLKGLPFAALSEADFASSASAHLDRKSVAVRMGVIDAFVSHSWNDSGATKWRVLSEWVAKRQLETGREAMLWLGSLRRLNPRPPLALAAFSLLRLRLLGVPLRPPTGR